ncbi:putative U-box domain containing protein [Trypanosoma cruzi]|nr:putative U-box domain containing protein [Trypanosoma cruzi]
MSIHGAITFFLDQDPGAIGVSALSCLASSLNEPGVAHSLVEQHRPACKEVLSRLVAVANDAGKNPNARILALESLYGISNFPDVRFRTGDLLDAVQKLNESFEEFLETQSTGNGDAQLEMLTVLLFRCSDYMRLKAGDLLRQLYNNDDARLVSTLQMIMKKRSLEWNIVHACVRCMYELTTPVTYFTAPDENLPIETTKVSAFQEKITTILIHFSEGKALQELFAELGARWAIAVGEERLEQILEGQSPVKDSVCDGVAMRFLGLFRYLAVMLLNLADFCERMDLVRGYQRSFITQHQSFLGDTVIPFLSLTLLCWEASCDTTLESQNNPFMNVAISVLRLLRFALYRPSQALQESLALSLRALTRHVHRLESLLCKEYVGMLVIVLTVEVLCNVNAVNVEPLTADFTALVNLISTDTNPLRPGAHFTVAQAFTYCLSNETSMYCAPDNESVSLLRQRLRFEDAEMANEAARVVQALEEQLGMLQTLMMELAVGQLIGDLSLFASYATGSIPSGQAPPVKTGACDTKQMPEKEKKKTKHPAKYVCMLTRKLMREPVVLRNGHHFELDALQEVVDRVGHVDPLTGEAFDEEIEVDMGLQQEIAQYRIKMAARGDNEAAGQEFQMGT